MQTNIDNMKADEIYDIREINPRFSWWQTSSSLLPK